MELFLQKYRRVLILLLIALLVPLAVVSVYNRPIYDDLCQPQPVHRAVQNGASLAEVLGVAVQGTLQSYHGWNGVFFSMFLSRIPPTVLNYRITYVHAVFFMLMLLASVLSLCKTVARLLSVSRVTGSLMGLLLAILFFTQMPSVAEGIYWYSAAVNYSFMFSLLLLLASGVLRWAYSALRGWRRWLSLAGLCVGFFLLGGGNFTTSTVAVVLYGYWMLAVLWRRKKRLWSLLPYLFLLFGYALAVLAPGNAVRMAGTGGYSLPEAVVYGLRNTFAFAFQNVLFYATLLLVVPVAVAFAKQARGTYSHPVLVLVASFVLLFAGFLPPLYSMRSNGPDRLLNIQFFLLCLLYAVNMVYLAGYFRALFRRFAFRLRPTNTGTDTALRRFWRRYLLAAAAVVLAALLVNVQVKPLRINSSVPSIKAVANLLDGQAQRFAQEYDAMVQQAQANPDGEVTVASVPRNELFLGLEIDEQPSGWNSSIFARYYGCKSIRFVK